MDTNNKWEYEKYWSLKKYPPRLEQINIINEICSAMEMGFKNIILEAGTGIGKSAIATTVAKMVEDSYILTMTNQLQTQYLQDFEYMLTEIKGRSNYACNYGGSCAECQMEKDNEKKCNDCLYIWSLREAQKSKNIITNYDYLYYAGNYAGLFGERSLLILDESHNFEKKIMSLTSKTLNRKTIIKKFGTKSINPAFNFLAYCVDDIKGERAKKIVNTLELNNLQDVMELSYNDLINVDGIGDKLANKIIKAIR